MEHHLVAVRVAELRLLRGKHARQFREQPGAGEYGRAAKKLIAGETQFVSLLQSQRVPQSGEQQVNRVGRERQQSARDDMVIAFGNHANRDAGPLLQGAGGGLLVNRDGPGVAQKVSQHHRGAGLDIADFIEADRRIAQRGEVGPVQRRLLPAATLQVEIDDVLVAIVTAEEVLEAASPKHARPLLAEKIGKLIVIDLELLERGHQVFGDHILQPFAPDLLATDEA